MMQIKWPASGSILLVAPSSMKKESEEMALVQAKKILTQEIPQHAILFDSKSHPDFCLVSPESGADWIKIDQVRELIDWVQGKPQLATKKIAIIAPAHALNLQAANALLKTLEEVSSSTLFILVTDKPSLLPATIKSRCFWIRIRNNSILENPLKEIILKDLEALQHDKENVVSISTRWLAHEPSEILQCFLIILHETLIKAVENNTKRCQQKWWSFLDKLFEARRLVASPNQPNIQLLLESLLIEYYSLNHL